MLPAEIVKQVRRIQFQTGRHVADVLAGQYLSVFKGQGMHGLELLERLSVHTHDIAPLIAALRRFHKLDQAIA